MCQALVYEILYRDVFKLPDINYAVERMLYDPDGVTTTIVGDPSNTLCGEYQDYGEIREFYFDRAEDTNCVLNNRDLCNFHNPQFHQFVAKVKKQDKVGSDGNARTLKSLLPMKEISCVCQLLNYQITPFPYKVAKSLDPFIYRNIDFDVWSDRRREQRVLRWNRNFIYVGMRCNVKLSKAQDKMYSCYIQNIPDNGPCEVFVEELGQKHRVPIYNLHPLNGTHWRSYMLPYKYARQSSEKRLVDDKKGLRFTNLMQYTTLDGINPLPIEVLAMPALTNIGGKDNDKEKDEEKNDLKQEDAKVYEGEYELCQEVPYVQTSPMYYSYDPMNGMYMMPQYMPMQSCYGGNFYMFPDAHAPMPIYQNPMPGVSGTPSYLGSLSPNTMMPQGQVQACSGRRCDGPVYLPNVDFNAIPSTAPNGADLPCKFSFSTII